MIKIFASFAGSSNCIPCLLPLSCVHFNQPTVANDVACTKKPSFRPDNVMQVQSLESDDTTQQIGRLVWLSDDSDQTTKPTRAPRTREVPSTPIQFDTDECLAPTSNHMSVERPVSSRMMLEIDCKLVARARKSRATQLMTRAPPLLPTSGLTGIDGCACTQLGHNNIIGCIGVEMAINKCTRIGQTSGHSRVSDCGQADGWCWSWLGLTMVRRDDGQV